MDMKTGSYDSAETLRTLDEMGAYLKACIEEADGDAACIAEALGDIARAQRIRRAVLQTGRSPESLYMTFQVMAA